MQSAMGTSAITAMIMRVENGSSSTGQDVLAVEEPLEIKLGSRSVSITMRTPGNDKELAAGFLFTEGILRDRNQISGIYIVGENRVCVSLTDGVELDLERLDRHFYMSSSCGVCGKTSIQALKTVGCPVILADRPSIDPALIYRMPEMLRSSQQVFDRTGGLHAAGLFHSDGTLLDSREDVGRHNAVDKLIGAAFLTGRLPLSDYLLMLSGRASFELVQKALMAGIGAIVAVGAPSSLAVEMARKYGVTLIGFARGERFNVYSGEFRLRLPIDTTPGQTNQQRGQAMTAPVSDVS
jgi:FdhD protein